MAAVGIYQCVTLHSLPCRFQCRKLGMIGAGMMGAGIALVAAQRGIDVVLIDRELSEVLEDGKNGYFADNDPRDFADKVVAIMSSKVFAADGDIVSLQAALVGLAEQKPALLVDDLQVTAQGPGHPAAQRLVVQFNLLILRSITP